MCVTVSAGLSLDMQHMKQILRLSVADQDVTVQPGIGYVELNAYLETVSQSTPHAHTPCTLVWLEWGLVCDTVRRVIG